MLFIFPQTLECILGFNVNHACVRVCLILMLRSLGQKVFMVIQRHHKIPTLLFSCSDSFNFSFIIRKTKNMRITTKITKKTFFHDKP